MIQNFFHTDPDGSLFLYFNDEASAQTDAVVLTVCRLNDRDELSWYTLDEYLQLPMAESLLLE